MKCKHEWAIITEKTLEFPFEQIKNIFDTIKGFTPGLFEITYICILQCKLCGKLNKTIVKNNGKEN